MGSEPDGAANEQETYCRAWHGVTEEGTSVRSDDGPAQGYETQSCGNPGGEVITARKPTAVDADNVWNKAREKLLKEKVCEVVKPQKYQDEQDRAAQYECARATFCTVPDGYQRGMTALEAETLHDWRNRLIFLPALPNFVTKTFTLAERMALRQIHDGHMGYNLRLVTPPQLKWPAETVKYHFCESLLRMDQVDGVPSDRVVGLLCDVHVITCSAESKSAVLRFVRPETRDKWLNQTFKFPFGTIGLKAADAIDQEDKSNGLDKDAVGMLYPIHLLGRPSLPITDVLMIAKSLCGGLPILDIVLIEPTGHRMLETRVWSITLNSMTGPPDLHAKEASDTAVPSTQTTQDKPAKPTKPADAATKTERKTNTSEGQLKVLTRTMGQAKNKKQQKKKTRQGPGGKPKGKRPNGPVEDKNETSTFMPPQFERDVAPDREGDVTMDAEWHSAVSPAEAAKSGWPPTSRPQMSRAVAKSRYPA